jgi:hypothetical protein
MRHALDLAILILFATAYSAAAIAWSVAAVYLFRTIANRRPGVRLWSAALGFVPLNIVFRPDLLTDRGQLYRRRFGKAAFFFAIAVGTGFALSGLLRALS